MRDLRDRVGTEIRKVVVGRRRYRSPAERPRAGGQHPLEGVPGVAKTCWQTRSARTVGGEFRRVQFTPTWLPLGPDRDDGPPVGRAGVSGAGRCSAALLLADEIQPDSAEDPVRRCSSRMQERQVSLDGEFPPPAGFRSSSSQLRTRSNTRHVFLCRGTARQVLIQADVGYLDEEQELSVLALGRAGVARHRSSRSHKWARLKAEGSAQRGRHYDSLPSSPGTCGGSAANASASKRRARRQPRAGRPSPRASKAAARLAGATSSPPTTWPRWRARCSVTGWSSHRRRSSSGSARGRRSRGAGNGARAAVSPRLVRRWCSRSSP